MRNDDLSEKRLNAQEHLDWLEKVGLYETAYLQSFCYIATDAIGPVSYDDDDLYAGEWRWPSSMEYEDWLHPFEYDDWELGRRKERKEIRMLNRRHSFRFRKKQSENI